MFVGFIQTATVEFEQLAQAHESLRAHIEGTLAAVEHASGSETAAFALLNRLHDTQAMLELEATQTQQVLSGLEATGASEAAAQLREYAEQTFAAREAVSDAHEQLSESLEQAHHAAQSQSEEMSAARLRVAQLEQHVAALESRQSSLVDAQHADAVSGNQAHGTHDARMIELSELQRDLANAQIRLEDSHQKLSKQRARKSDDDMPLFQLDVLTPDMINPEFSLKKRSGDKLSTGKKSDMESVQPKQQSDRPDFTLAVARLRRVLNVAMDIKRGEFVLRKRSIGAVDLDAKAPADATGPAFRLRQVSLDKPSSVEKAFDIDEPKVTVHGVKKGAAEFTIRQVHQPAAQAAEFALRQVESSDQSLKGAIFLSQASEALDVHEAFELTEVKPNRPIKVRNRILCSVSNFSCVIMCLLCLSCRSLASMWMPSRLPPLTLMPSRLPPLTLTTRSRSLRSMSRTVPSR
jgi:myosin heavy subunit